MEIRARAAELGLGLLVCVLLCHCTATSGLSQEASDCGPKCHQPRQFDDETTLLQVPSESVLRKRIGSRHEVVLDDVALLQTDDALAIAKTRKQAHEQAATPRSMDRPAASGLDAAAAQTIGLVQAATTKSASTTIVVLAIPTTIAVLAVVGLITLIAAVGFGWYMARRDQTEGFSAIKRAINATKSPTGSTRAYADGAATPRSADGRSSAGESMAESDKEMGESCDQVTFAFGCYFPAQIIFSTLTILILIVQQIFVLPFRICGGRVLTMALNFWGPLTAPIYCAFVSLNHGELNYGREIDDLETFDDLLDKYSAIKRKNIRRNYRAAVKEFESQGVQVEFRPAGSWWFSREIRDLLWRQCCRHGERAHSYADLTNCKQPVPPWLFYLGEVVVIWAFPCDIQLFRTRDGTLVAANTRMHIGNVYFNPNYACNEDHGKLGIYAWSHWQTMNEAFRLRARMVNFMPSMRGPKKSLGLRPLPLCSLVGALWSWTRSPRDQVPEMAASSGSQSPQRAPCSGGKRAARKKAALAGTTDSTPSASLKACTSATTLKSCSSEEGGTSQTPTESEEGVGPLPHASPKSTSMPGGKRAARKKAALESKPDPTPVEKPCTSGEVLCSQAPAANKGDDQSYQSQAQKDQSSGGKRAARKKGAGASPRQPAPVDDPTPSTSAESLSETSDNVCSSFKMGAQASKQEPEAVGCIFRPAMQVGDS